MPQFDAPSGCYQLKLRCSSRVQPNIVSSETSSPPSSEVQAHGLFLLSLPKALRLATIAAERLISLSLEVVHEYAMIPQVSLSLVDLGGFFRTSTSGDNASLLSRKATAATLSTACEATGIFYVTLGKGVISSLTAPAFKAAEEIFALPKQCKDALAPTQPKVSAARGYLPCGAESGSELRELKECFACAPEPTAPANLNLLQAPNVWPQEHDCGDELRLYLSCMKDVAAAISRAMALALDDSELENLAEGGHEVSMLRIFHYFAGGGSYDAGEVGSSPHSDWGMFTIIAPFQSVGDDSSLQVFVNSEWRYVPSPGNDSVVVNCGDYLQLRTQGRFKSPLHRVVLSPFERISLCFFQYPAYEAPVPDVSPSSGFCAANRPLSLLSNQADTTDSDEQGSVKTSYFGVLVAAKWAQVSR
jgi:isopenicillin N synthase-like dioxygenase